MAQTRPTITKRMREKGKLEKRQLKQEKKAERAAEKEAERGSRDPNVDPDIAHIVPGPQKPLWEDDDY